MPTAIEFFLDEPTAGVIRQIWREIAEAEISSYLHTSGIRPHVTLAVGERVDEPGGASRLRHFAAQTPPLSLTFAHLGISPGETPNLFLTPIVTDELLRLHRSLHEQFAGLIEAPSERYQPGRWTPHCTLIERVPSDVLCRAVEVCRRASLPLEARLDEIGIVSWRPVRQHCAFPLGPAQSASE
jgi:2'-5' RNA ligase